MEFFETHAHYDDEKFNKDREHVLNKIFEAGVTKCVNVGCSIETSKRSIDLAKKYDFIYAMCGIHPSEISNSEQNILNDIQELQELVLSSKMSNDKNNKCKKMVVAIGEIGLDYHYEGFDKSLQQLAFIEQIKLANELNLPIAVHTRDAIDDTIAILRECKVNNGGILHCCPFNRELVKHGLENGFYIAFGGTSTFKNSKNASEIVNMVPDDKLLIETDCPYLAPEPLRGTRNDSSNLKYVVQRLAEFRGVDLEYIAKLTYENASRFLTGDGSER